MLVPFEGASGRSWEAYVKPKIHPELHTVLVHCQCGNEFYTRSIKKEMRVEICAVCHPFFTGKQKILDTEGRVEKFHRKYKMKTQETPMETPTETPIASEN